MELSNARALMHEWTASLALRIHMEAVGACVAAYARLIEPAQEERWRVCGILHDFDYERHPSAEEHPIVGVRHLEALGVDRETLDAILGHAAERTGVARESALAKALFACDELAGFIVACCKVRPDGIASLEASSVKKKLKDKGFAAAVSREDIQIGADELGAITGRDLTSHVQLCIDALRGERLALGV